MRLNTKEIAISLFLNVCVRYAYIDIRKESRIVSHNIVSGYVMACVTGIRIPHINADRRHHNLYVCVCMRDILGTHL
jgi:hypothetical protein